eukprot:GEMP01065568.1.p1 GENE.GEMP01065568.1~~GEMP01065568.1.p1  ORF type:complete len:190 (+),score=33.85 GEMP01065568.1:333-902(+)
MDVRGHEILVQGSAFCIWPSAQLLAEWIIDHPEKVRGKRVVELGCGAGLPSMAAAKVGAKEVIATDCCNLALAKFSDLIRRNRWENVSILNVDWFAVQKGEQAVPEADIVLCADVNYYSASIGPLAHCIAAAGRECVLVSREGRVSLDEFINYLQDNYAYRQTCKERLANEKSGNEAEDIHSLWCFERD